MIIGPHQYTIVRYIWSPPTQCALPSPFFIYQIHYASLSPLNLAPLAAPLDPAARVLPDPLPAGLARDARGGPAAHPGLAVEDDLVVIVVFGLRAREPEPVLKLLRADVEAVRARRDRDVEGPRDPARLADLAGLADVDEGYVGREVLDLGRRRERVSMGT